MGSRVDGTAVEGRISGLWLYVCYACYPVTRGPLGPYCENVHISVSHDLNDQEAESKQKIREGSWEETKPHVIVDCTRDDLEDIRQLLLSIPEYPVKYGPSTMRSFSRTPRFYEMCVVAKEVKVRRPLEAGPEAETDVDTDAEHDARLIGRVVGVVAAAEMRRGSANIIMVAVDEKYRRMGLGREPKVYTYAAKFYALRT